MERGLICGIGVGWYMHVITKYWLGTAPMQHLSSAWYLLSHLRSGPGVGSYDCEMKPEVAKPIATFGIWNCLASFRLRCRAKTWCWCVSIMAGLVDYQWCPITMVQVSGSCKQKLMTNGSSVLHKYYKCRIIFEILLHIADRAQTLWSRSILQNI